MLLASYANASDFKTDFLRGEYKTNSDKNIEVTQKYPCELFEFNEVIRERIEKKMTSYLETTSIPPQEWKIKSTSCNLSAVPEDSKKVLESAINYYNYAIDFYNNSKISNTLGEISQREVVRVNNYSNNNVVDAKNSVYFANHFIKGRFATFKGSKTNHEITIEANYPSTSAIFDGNKQSVYVSTAHPSVVLYAPYSENFAQFFLQNYGQDVKSNSQNVAHTRLETITESLSHILVKDLINNQKDLAQHVSMDLYSQNEIYKYVPQAVDWIENHSAAEAVSLYLKDSNKFMDAIKK